MRAKFSQHFPDDVLFKVSRHRVPFFLGFQKKNMVGKSLRFPDKFQRISALVELYRCSSVLFVILYSTYFFRV